MFGLIRKRRVADVLSEMRWRASKEGYVQKEARSTTSSACSARAPHALGALPARRRRAATARRCSWLEATTEDDLASEAS